MKFDYADIHAHLNFAAFDPDREEVIKRAQAEDVCVFNVGTQKDTSLRAVELANKYDGFFAIVGLHPIHTSKSYHDKSELGEGGEEFTSRGEKFDYVYYKKLGSDNKVVGIGECGLDYYRIESDALRIKQEEIFRKHVELSLELDKPLMLHVRSGSGRSAYKEAGGILSSYKSVHGLRLRGVAHCFTGSVEEAKILLDLGFCVSFSGVITFPPKKGLPEYTEVVREIPLNMIMADTDSPYLAPVPFRGKRNEPINVREIYKKIAEIKKLPEEDVRLAINSNAATVFGLKTTADP